MTPRTLSYLKRVAEAASRDPENFNLVFTPELCAALVDCVLVAHMEDHEFPSREMQRLHALLQEGEH